MLRVSEARAIADEACERVNYLVEARGIAERAIREAAENGCNAKFRANMLHAVMEDLRRYGYKVSIRNTRNLNILWGPNEDEVPF